MAHPIPKELKGEERLFTLPIINIHFNKKGLIFNGAATILSGVILKLTNFWVFVPIFLITNMIAYPMGHMKTPKNRFEGGNVPLDKFFIRRFKYKKFKQNIYVRRRGN